MDSDPLSPDPASSSERDDSARGADPAPPAPRPPWMHLWLMSSIGLAVGVLGTAAYIMWFSGDMQAYEQAIQAARDRPATVSGPPLRGAPAAGPVVHVEAATTADPASSAARAAPASGPPASPVAGTHGEAGTETDASAAVDAKETRTPYLASRHHTSSPPKPTLFARIGSALRRVGYRHHASGHDQGTYTHP